MYEIKTDTHTHTIFSGHAYSTVEENVRAAKEQGMEAVAITDHFSRLFVPDTSFQYYGNFGNFKALPEEWYGGCIICSSLPAPYFNLNGANRSRDGKICRDCS